MMEKEEYLRRLDKQDEILERLVQGQADILTKMREHRAEHEAVDPSVKELVGILKGLKFMKATTVLFAAIVGSAWVTLVWIRDHLHWKW